MPGTFEPMPTVARILAEHGPLHDDDIERRLRDDGLADADMDELLDEMDYPVRQLVDDRWVWLPTLLAGRVFTHRVCAAESAHDILTVTPDLDPITALCDHEQYRQLVDGSPARVVLAELDYELLKQRDIPAEMVDPLGALLLAPGTLAALGVTEGDLVGLRLTEHGLQVEHVEPVEPVADTALAALLAVLPEDEPVYFDAAVWTACAGDPELFTEPLPPLSEIVDEYGLARDGEWLAQAEFDFGSWNFERECAALARLHDLDPDSAFALYTMIRLYENVVQAIEIIATDADGNDEQPGNEPVEAGADQQAPGEDPVDDVIGELGGALADPLLADLFLEETVGRDPDGAPALGMFAEMMEPQVPRTARVAFRWLRAVAQERIGDIDMAERELLAAESMDPDWPLPLFDLARIASDRGEVERGLALLRRADAAPDHPLLELLQRYRSEPRNDLGRNQPCWCGSGRKYKKCHLGHEEVALAERAAWLYAKASQHALLNGWDDLLADTAHERCRHAEDEREAFEAALADPVVLDAVLFEGGAFEEFLEVRGSLLPNDERLLAQQWLLADRSVFEIEQVHPGRGMTLRDVRTGDTHEVRERTASRQLKPGQLVCARVVPAGDTMQLFGGLEPVALHERDPLIELLDTEPDPITLVAALSRRFAPPTLANTEGDPLAICEATLNVGDPVGIEDALDATYDRAEGDEPPRWLEHVATDGMRRVRATLVLEGDTLRVETNSEERMDRALAALARLDPGMSVLEDCRRPIHDARQAAELANQMPMADDDALDPDDPELAGMLDGFIRDYEIKWLDEPIPALQGHSPRQAADDPTRRGDLIKLLDSFPAGAAARGGMNTDRLRAALGL